MAADYPEAPVVGVGAVVVNDGKALIVKRAHEPRKGEWSLPGGRVELGESLVAAARREIKEETGLDIDVGPIVEVFDRIHRHEARVRYHFVIVDYLCMCVGGTLCAGDDAEDVAWVTGDELERYAVNEFAAAVIRKGLAMARGSNSEMSPG
jgi:ADP-ribose pyrophosphatase YjhB (NUDIX family)